MEQILVLALMTLVLLFGLVLFAVLYILVLELVNLFMYKHRTGLLGVNRFSNKVYMIYSFEASMKYYKTKNKIKKFYINCLRLIEKLEKDKEYKTFNHEEILEHMKKRKEIQIIEAVYSKDKRHIIKKIILFT